MKDLNQHVYNLQTLAWCDRSFFILQSLPSSIGQSIRLKCVESEGCEFDPHGGPFSFKNVYVTGGSPQEDLLLYVSIHNFVQSSYNNCFVSGLKVVKSSVSYPVEFSCTGLPPMAISPLFRLELEFLQK